MTRWVIPLLSLSALFGPQQLEAFVLVLPALSNNVSTRNNVLHHPPLASSLFDYNDNDGVLADRIQQLKKKEDTEAEKVAMGLSNRFLELQRSEEMERLLETESELELPAISFDALLPNQTLEGNTVDPNFCRFLRDRGLGGWFVMTSLDLKTRKIRRHGVLAKIAAVDVIMGKNNNNNKEEEEEDWIPTSVEFCFVGYSRCRIMGPRQGLKRRIGRWRRGYDPDGEEVVLGWGEERFVDAPDELEITDSEDTIETPEDNNKAPCTEWSSVLVDVSLDPANNTDYAGDESQEQNSDDKGLQAKADSLIPLVDEWYALAANAGTYQNSNVTASTRIRRDHPGLWVDPQKLLQRVSKQLGPRPSATGSPTAFCFWVAALINPLPALGVSLEIRGQLLEAPTLKRRLQVLEWGLVRSIDNLKGTRPL